MNHNNPFIHVEWEDSPENLTQERLRRVKSYFQNKYNSTNVKLVTKILSNDLNGKLKSLDASDNILDQQYQKQLAKDFIKENEITVDWELLNRLDNKVNARIDLLNQHRVRYNKWYLKKIEFSNFLSFGEDNVLEFSELDGITVIESTPKNFGGKTTISVDLLLFLFFNTTTKTKTISEFFNKFTDKDEVKVKGYVVIDGEDYIITRIVTRKKTKTGEYTVKNDLEFSKVSDGDVHNLSGEQRRETESIITSAIGTEEDFLSTILTTGKNLEELIDSKPTSRGQILSKFLGLESLKQKEEIAKDIYNDWSKKLISNTHNINDLETKNQKFSDEIDFSTLEITRLGDELKTIEEKLLILERRRDILLGSRNADIDQELIKVNPGLLQKEIDELKQKKDINQKLVDEIIVKEPSKYYYEEDHDKLKMEISGLVFDGKINKEAIERNEKLIIEFEEGVICPTCKRPLQDVDHTDEINQIKKLIEDFKRADDKLNKKLEKLQEKEKSFNLLKIEYETYEKNKLRKSRYELEVDQKIHEINVKETRLENYNKNKKKLEENQKIDGEIITLKTQIETSRADINVISVNTEKNKNIITNSNEKIQINLELIKKIKSEEELIPIFKTYFIIYGKNGISKMIIKNMIPLLNQELHRILCDSSHFTLELNINDKNEMEFLMIDNETRVVKPLYGGSGYEKTISSLAIRSVLTKISSLPKPNIVVMDEVFGKVADENLELVGEFFKKIKNYFEHIIVISHNPLIRNWSDNIVMIKKEENISSIDFITTKIS